MLEDIVFLEGRQVRRIRGEVVQETDKFIRLKTLSRTFKIYHHVIIKREEEA